MFIKIDMESYFFLSYNSKQTYELNQATLENFTVLWTNFVIF